MCENKWPKRPKFKAIVIIIIIRLVFRCISVVVKCLNVRMSCKWLVAVAVSLDGCSIATDVSEYGPLIRLAACSATCWQFIYIYKAVISERNSVLLASERHCLYMKLTPVTNMLPCYWVIEPWLRCSCVFYVLLRIWRRCIPCRAAQVFYCDGLHRPVDNDTSAIVAFAVTYIIWLVTLLTAVSCHLSLPWLRGWGQVLSSVSRFNELFYMMSRQIPTV